MYFNDSYQYYSCHQSDIIFHGVCDCEYGFSANLPHDRWVSDDVRGSVLEYIIVYREKKHMLSISYTCSQKCNTMTSVLKRTVAIHEM